MNKYFSKSQLTTEWKIPWHIFRFWLAVKYKAQVLSELKPNGWIYLKRSVDAYIDN